MKSLFYPCHSALAPAAFAADQPAIYQAALANPARSDKDRERDLRDKPADILALAGIRPGMTVADVFGAGGYWSEILAGVVGPEGRRAPGQQPALRRVREEGIRRALRRRRLPA